MRWVDGSSIEAQVLCPSADLDPVSILAQPPSLPFSNDSLAFIDDFSSSLSKSAAARRHPGIMALAFWMRRANLNRIRSGFAAQYAEHLLIGRGLAFHIAPANVETLWVYSLFLSLLAGNTNIVRVSSNATDELSVLVGLLDEVLARHPGVRRRLLVVRYGHDDSLTAAFSAVCDLRVIWGGDDTVNKIRRIPLPPHASEVAFPGKFSVAVIDAAVWNAERDHARTARAFCLDAFTFNQQGCSSPKLVYWLGDTVARQAARESFWKAVEAAAPSVHDYSFGEAEAMTRFVSVCSAAIAAEGAIARTDAASKLYTTLSLSTLGDIVRDANVGHGMFYEYGWTSLDPLLGWFGASDQTVTSYGVSREKWRTALEQAVPRGICRVVPFGSALEFFPVWDGYDLLRAFCREVVIAV